MPNKKDVEKLNATADVLDEVATFGEYLAALAEQAGEHEKAEEIRRVQLPVLSDFAAIYRAAAEADDADE